MPAENNDADPCIFRLNDLGGSVLSAAQAILNFLSPANYFVHSSINPHDTRVRLLAIDMNRLRNAAIRSPNAGQFTSVVRPSCRQTAIYERLLEQTQRSNLHSRATYFSSLNLYSSPIPLRSKFLLNDIRTAAPPSSRTFHYGSRLGQEKEANSKTEQPKSNAPEEEAPKKESGEKSEPGEEKPKDESEREGEGKKEEDKKEAPPPPPHGDKSPWQVFTETLQTEFKASKEWNESTKALAAGAQQFTENESVRRAREAYQSTTGAVSSTAGNVLKTTAGAVGKGAAWTWETPVVKGVRSTVNATASVIEKGTRPIRETEAFKNVKNVIDDGSSSRYGGWVEKEERRKARELRELKEAQASGGTGRRIEVMKEDPE
jgi:import inner membrane translocase subunit TIM44